MRSVLQNGSLASASIQRSTPRVQLHAPRSARVHKANDPPAAYVAAVAGASAFITGYGVDHPYPPLVAASVAMMWNSLASAVPTPACLASHSAYGRVMYELGCRADPCDFNYWDQKEGLDHESCVDRPIYFLAAIRGGACGFAEHFGEDSVLHRARWPGYPAGWRALWHGALWGMLR